MTTLRWGYTGVLMGLLIAVVTLPASATHLVDHRFTVTGTVRDGSSFPGKPLTGREVTVTDPKNGQVMARGKTDKDGRYAIKVHVHNADLGRRLTVEVMGVQQPLELTFDPKDVTTEREHRIDFVVFPKTSRSPETTP